MADIMWDGFDKYGIPGQGISAGGGFFDAGTAMQGYWTMLGNGASPQPTLSFAAGRFGGSALQLATTVSASTGASKTLPASYPTIIFGIAFKGALTGTQGFAIADTGTVQVSIGFNTAGQIEVRRGTVASGTLLATSVQSITANSWHYLEASVTIHNTAGAVAVNLDGVATSINLTSQNTRASSNNSGNQFQLVTSGGGTTWYADDLYIFDNTGGVNNAMRGDSRVETLFPAADSAVQFSFGAAVFGAAYYGAVNSAPGANQLVLRPFTTNVAGTLNDVRLSPAATSAAAKFKAVLYNDSAGAPSGAPVATGTEVIGCTGGTTLVLPFAAGQSLSASTRYWIGYITDTSVALNGSDTNALGYKASNTYASGAPATPVMTSGQTSWMIWGNLTATGHNWPEVAGNPLGALSYVFDSTVGHEDLLSHGSLSATPQSIAGVKVTAYMSRSDAGARTVSLRIKSGSSDSGGSSTGQTPSSSSYTWLESYFDTDPNTAAAWLAAGVNSAALGYKVDS